jgi:hypothetical protein
MRETAQGGVQQQAGQYRDKAATTANDVNSYGANSKPVVDLIAIA